MQIRSVLAVALLAGLLLAGCSGGKPGPGPSGVLADDNPAQVEVDPRSDQGAISGVVVDDAIRPLAGARIAFSDGSRNTTSNDGGTFAFTDLEPGAYFLESSLAGHKSMQSSVQVEAGKVTAVKVQLPMLGNATGAYHYTLHNTGFIQASAALGGAIADAFFDSFSFIAGDNPFCQRCVFTVETAGLNVSTLVTEAMWDNTLAPVTSDTLFLAILSSNFTAAGPNYGEEIPSPYLRHFDTDEDYFPDHHRTTYFRYQVSGGLAQPNYNQQYELYITVFVDGDAPAGWSLANGDA